MTVTRRFLRNLADGLEAAKRLDDGSIVLTAHQARMLADGARALAGSPLPTVLSMPERVDQLIHAEFRTPFKAA